jgi:ACT domain-containing protein
LQKNKASIKAEKRCTPILIQAFKNGVTKITAAQAMKEWGMSKSTFYRQVKQKSVFFIYNMRE